MDIKSFFRRSFILSTLALAACETTGVSAGRALTNAYDGDYQIVVSRFWNETPSNLADPFFRTEPEQLALLDATVESGRFELQRIENKTGANAYGVFEAAFYEGGVLEIRTTVGYIVGVGKTDSYRLRTAAIVGNQLLSGDWVSFEPNAGYSVEYSPHISIRKVN
jgi:hypothetical protein